MKRRFPIYFICFVIFLQIFSVWAVESEDSSIHLVILHVNDTHGRLSPYDTAEAKSIGGIARMTTKIKEIREANPGRALALHAGDVFSRGDHRTVHSGGGANILAMGLVGYDAFVPGNGEYYFGVKNLIQQMALAKFPVLSANVFYKNNGERLFKPYIIKEVAGVKVAILGLGFVRLLHPSGWFLELKDPAETAKEYLPILREEADIVLALTHIGLEADKKLAAAVPQLDIIVGGHSHSKLDEPLRISGANEEGEVIVVQANDYGKFLGRLDVYLQRDQSGKYSIADAEGKLLPIDSSIKEDAEVNALLERYSQPLLELVCTSEIMLTNPAEGDSPMGDLAAEALRSVMKTDAALLDRGAVRGEIVPGEVTLVDVYKIHPWHNRVMEIEMTGAELQKVLVGQDLFVAGLSYSDVDGKIEGMKINSSPVEPDKTYRIAVGEFVFSHIPSLREMPFKITNEKIDTVLVKYLKQVKVIK